MQPSSLPPKKRNPQETPPQQPPAPPSTLETSKIRGTAPPRSPRIGPAFQADLPSLRARPPVPPPDEAVGGEAEELGQ